MEKTDFGKLALLVNESCGIKGRIQIGNISGEIRITWDNMTYHLVSPLDLREILMIRRMELAGEQSQIEWDKDSEPVPYTKRIIDCRLADVDNAMLILEQLNDWQKKQPESSGESQAHPHTKG